MGCLETAEERVGRRFREAREAGARVVFQQLPAPSRVWPPFRPEVFQAPPTPAHMLIMAEKLLERIGAKDPGIVAAPGYDCPECGKGRAQGTCNAEGRMDGPCITCGRSPAASGHKRVTSSDTFAVDLDDPRTLAFIGSIGLTVARIKVKKMGRTQEARVSIARHGRTTGRRSGIKWELIVEYNDGPEVLDSLLVEPWFRE